MSLLKSRFRVGSWLVFMMLLLAGSLSSPAAAAPCSGSMCLQPGMDYTMAMQVNLLQRTFLVHVPAKYSNANAVPLLLDLHGYNGTADGQRATSGQLQESDNRGFIAVWPQGTAVQQGILGGSWNGYGCCASGNLTKVDDVKFLRQVISRIELMADIDASRVYVSGLSNGGSMAQRMACEAADVIRASGPVSFPLNTNQCHPSKPINVTEFASLGDKTIPYNGSGNAVINPVVGVTSIPFTVQSAPASFAAWKKIDGCTDAHTVIPLSPNTTHSDVYTVCQGGVRVGLVTLDSPPHTIDGFQISGMSVASYMWSNVFNQ